MAANKLIIGAHAIIYSRKPEADRAFLRDILGLPYVDVGDQWLIFGLPPAELAIHPSSRNNVHELYFVCKDIDGFVAAMHERGIVCSPIQVLSWGKRTQVRLPGGGKLGVYQPLHARPRDARRRKSTGSRIRSRKP